mgnify:FL=1|jgi:hypothetical protein
MNFEAGTRVQNNRRLHDQDLKFREDLQNQNIVLADEKALKRNQKKSGLPLFPLGFVKDGLQESIKAHLRKNPKAPKKPASEAFKNVFLVPATMNGVDGSIIQTTGIGKRIIGSLLSSLQKTTPQNIHLF